MSNTSCMVAVARASKALAGTGVAFNCLDGGFDNTVVQGLQLAPIVRRGQVSALGGAEASLSGAVLVAHQGVELDGLLVAHRDGVGHHMPQQALNAWRCSEAALIPAGTMDEEEARRGSGGAMPECLASLGFRV